MRKWPSHFLVVWLATSLSAAAASTTPVALIFNGRGSIVKSKTIKDFEAQGAGSVTPFGAATVSISGTADAGTMTLTFPNGDSIRSTFSVPNGQNATAFDTTATIGGGTGVFNNAAGSVDFLLTGVPASDSSSDFTLSGFGAVTSPDLTAAISVSPSAMTFPFAQGDGAVARQPVTLSSRGSQLVPFSAVARVSDGGTWLSVSPADANAAPFSTSSLMVTANPGGLGPGTYLGTVMLTGGAGAKLDLPVTMTVSAASQSIVLSQTGLRFVVASGASAPPAEDIFVIDPAAGSLDWSATASTLSGGSSWLSVTPASGTSGAFSNGRVAVAIDPKNLHPGDYYGSVQLSSAEAANSPQAIAVVLNVFPANSVLPAIIRPAGLVFTGRQGDANPAPQVVTVANRSNQPLTMTTGTLFRQGVGWFTANLESATVSPSQPVQFQVSISLAGLQAGVYNGVLDVLSSDGSLQPVSILLVVTPQGVAPAPAAALAANCVPSKLLPVFTTLESGFLAMAPWPVPLGVWVVDDCGAPLQTGSVVASFSAGDPPLPLNPLGDGRWAGTWQPGNTTASYAVITVEAQSPPVLRGTAQISGSVDTNQVAPRVFHGGAVSSASFVPNTPLSPGGLVSVFGSRMATAANAAQSLPLPTQLGGTRVYLGGRLMPLLFSSAGQINAMVPYDLPPNTTQQLIVRQNAAYSSPETVAIAPAQPATFTADSSGEGAGVFVAVKPGGAQFLVDAAHPATAGDILVIFCAGLGAVKPPVVAGTAGPVPPPRTTNSVTVKIGGKQAPVLFAGLAPTFAGLYQINATVPSGIAAAANVPVILTIAGFSSPPVTIPIH